MTARLLADTVARFDGVSWWLMNRAAGGWREYAVPLRSLADVAEVYGARVGTPARDEHGVYVTVSR